MQEVICKGCNGKFTTQKSNKCYCSRDCQRRAASMASKASSPRTSYLDADVPTGTIGAIHELVVCADLMRKGFHVFRAQSPACPCDLVCMNGNRIVRIEVKTGHRLENGKLTYPVGRLDPDSFDVLAVILYDGEIIYLNNSYESTALNR